MADNHLHPFSVCLLKNLMKQFFVALMLMMADHVVAQQPKVFQDVSGALRGYDVVAYFKDGKPTKGSSDFVFRWNEADWYFANAENLEAFKQAPEKFAPQYGGYCAFGASRGYKAETQPDAFTIFNGKLYLNYNTDVMKTWTQKKESFILKADEHWKKIANE
jgi:YHS domain-containing protein